MSERIEGLSPMPAGESGAERHVRDLEARRDELERRLAERESDERAEDQAKRLRAEIAQLEEELKR